MYVRALSGSSKVISLLTNRSVDAGRRRVQTASLTTQQCKHVASLTKLQHHEQAVSRLKRLEQFENLQRRYDTRRASRVVATHPLLASFCGCTRFLALPPSLPLPLPLSHSRSLSLSLYTFFISLTHSLSFSRAIVMIVPAMRTVAVGHVATYIRMPCSHHDVLLHQHILLLRHFHNARLLHRLQCVGSSRRLSLHDMSPSITTRSTLGQLCRVR